jgi:hypothetical protein
MSHNLKSLQAEWYVKLAESGFKDIENDKGLLINWSGSALRDDIKPITSKREYSSKLFKESQAEYYRLAAQHLHDGKFKSVLDKVIWSYHVGGLSFRRISEIVFKSKDCIQYKIDIMRKGFKL